MSVRKNANWVDVIISLIKYEKKPHEEAPSDKIDVKTNTGS
jgi:hypothetical protein